MCQEPLCCDSTRMWEIADEKVAAGACGGSTHKDTVCVSYIARTAKKTSVHTTHSKKIYENV